MTSPKPLSPAAQAVMDAAYALPLKNGQPSIGDTLRALAENHGTPTRGGAVILDGDDVLAIAIELEGSDV